MRAFGRSRSNKNACRFPAPTVQTRRAIPSGNTVQAKPGSRPQAQSIFAAGKNRGLKKASTIEATMWFRINGVFEGSQYVFDNKVSYPLVALTGLESD